MKNTLYQNWLENPTAENLEVYLNYDLQLGEVKK